MFNARFLLCALLLSSLFGERLIVEDRDGERFSFELSGETTLKELDQMAREFSKATLELESCSLGEFRCFDLELTEKEKEDISYIVTTLGDKATPKLILYKGELEAAGDRILQVHPFRFLAFVFGSDVLKVKVKAIRSKSFVWKDFFGGLEKSLREEAARGNLTEAMLESFAKETEYDVALLRPSMERRNFEEFVDLLIKHMKRKGEPGRYDL